ncbi:hypothetical protein SEA_DIRTYBOI_38 [Gordonia phage DirtyBoi]|nr:hypothetical protein SEA_DIRTYBOI_38 [Gordonia phage DirtyBoi]
MSHHGPLRSGSHCFLQWPGRFRVGDQWLFLNLTRSELVS